MAPVQQFSVPPGRAEQPAPPHSPHSAAQQLVPAAIPVRQFGSAPGGSSPVDGDTPPEANGTSAGAGDTAAGIDEEEVGAEVSSEG